jgi:hypothetical protein
MSMVMKLLLLVMVIQMLHMWYKTYCFASLDSPFTIKELGIWSNHNSFKVILKQILDQIL